MSRMFKKGITAWIASAIFLALWALLTCGWLFRWVYFVEPTRAYRNWTRAVSAKYVFFSCVFDFVLTGIFVLFYALIHKAIPGENAKKGLIFGFALWLAGWAVSWARVGMAIDVSSALFVYWMVNGLVSYLGAGVIIGKIYR